MTDRPSPTYSDLSCKSVASRRQRLGPTPCTHCLAALLKYKALSQERQAKGLDAMVAASQKLGLYDAELEGLPVKSGR